jgi:hypothetical protein
VPDEKHYLAFVDSIAASPAMRLDMSGGTRGPFNMRDGTRFDPPPLKRSLPSTLLADGGTPTSSAYDNRVCLLKLGIMDAGKFRAADPAATAIQLLMRELDRPSNFLRYQAGTSAPVFFRTYRSGPDTVDFDPITREVTVSLLAEPFAYGLKESLSPVTVTANPAAGANGMFFDVTSPKGDVETLLNIAITNGTVGLGATGRVRSGLAVRRRGTVANTPLFLQAEAMTQGTDTTTQANSASFSGSGNNYSRCTFGTPSGQQRLSANPWPSGSSGDYRGTYRVFLRCRQNTGTDSIDVQLQYGTSAAIISNDIVRVPGDTNIKYLDLGLIQFPSGYDPVTDSLSGVELAVQGTFLAIYVRRNSGTGTFDMDLLLFMPADDRSEYIKWPEVQAFSTDIFVAEGGPRPAAYCLDTTGYIRTTQTIEISGGGMMITPGRTNRVFFARDLGTGTAATGSGDSITATSVLTASYYPRYLGGFRPAAS